MLYESRPDKGYSLTDCISMVSMRERNSFDARSALYAGRLYYSASLISLSFLHRQLAGYIVVSARFDLYFVVVWRSVISI